MIDRPQDSAVLSDGKDRSIHPISQHEHLDLIHKDQAIDDHAIVSMTDAAGTIIRVNDMFCQISGYPSCELLGNNHRFVKSDQHAPEFYAQMWQVISSGRTWHGVICNRRKNGKHYWVQATIVPFLDDIGVPYKYLSIGTDVSQFKAFEQELRILQKAVESSPSSILIADARQNDLPLTYVNPAFVSMSGYRPEEVLGRNYLFLHAHDWNQPELLELRKSIVEKRPGKALLRNYRKDDSAFLNEIRVAPVQNEQGQVTHLVAITDDVTEREQIFNRLAASEDRLRRSQSYANIGTWDWNIQTGELYWSERIAPLFGMRSIEKATYKDFLKVVHPEDRKKVHAAVFACLKLGQKYDIEHRCVWPDGSVHWMLERGDVVRDRDGVPLQMLGIVQDITRRKNAELALRKNESHLNAAQRIAHFGQWATDYRNSTITWSDEVYRIFGQDPKKFIPSSKNFYQLVHPDDVQAIRNSEQAALDTHIHDVVYRVMRPDGRMCWVRELAEMVLDEYGSPASLLGTVQDITVIKQAEFDLIQARDEAERASRAKSEFLSNMSHELRTPMNAILGFSQLLDSDPTLEKEQRESVGEILKAGRHLLDLINEVLDLSRVEAGRIELSLEPLSFQDIKEECLALIEVLALDQGIAIECSLADNFVFWADRTRFKQVLINLFSNAIKYNRKGGRISIRSAPGSRSSLGRILISDTGSGIPPNRLPELFQPFNRLDATGSGIEGTGVGLALSKRLLEVMGGDIGVESLPARGSTFWLELPLFNRIPFQTQRPQNVLYIGDNLASIRLISHMLSQRPHLSLHTAISPSSAADMAQIQQPDLLLLDLGRPEANSLNALAELRAHEVLQQIAVIAIAADASTSEIAHGLAAGFSGYLTKPISIECLFAAIDSALKHDKAGEACST